jgi:fucose permease
MGVGQSLFGPGFEPLAARFDIDLSAVSLIVSLHFLGAGVAILAAGLLISRFSYARVLAGSAGLFGAGALLVGLLGSWPLVLAAALLMGVGFGVLNVTSNLVLLRHFHVRAAMPLNLISALFGVGAVLGPLLLGALLPRVGMPFLILGACALLAGTLNLRIPEPEPLTAAQGGRAPLGLANLLGFLTLFFIYVAAENSGASWEATHLAPHFGVATAAYLTSLYWLALTAGRFLALPLSGRFKPRSLVLGASAAVMTGALLTFITPFAPVAYIIMGMALAPIFPTSLVWLQQVFPARAEQITPVVMSVANLGAVLSAPVIGLAVTRHGGVAIPSALALLAGLLLATVALLHFRTRSVA